MIVYIHIVLKKGILKNLLSRRTGEQENGRTEERSSSGERENAVLPKNGRTEEPGSSVLPFSGAPGRPNRLYQKNTGNRLSQKL